MEIFSFRFDIFTDESVEELKEYFLFILDF